MSAHELIVRINGVQAAFSTVGRRRQFEPRVSTSVSLFLFTEGKRAAHILLDVGPGVPEAIQADDVFPPPFPLDWVLLSHAHADHIMGLELLSGDLRHWSRVGPNRSGKLRLLTMPETFSAVERCFSYLAPQIDYRPGQTGVPFRLWQDGDASLDVTFLEVLHFQRSVSSVFTFRDGDGGEARVVCLFDFGDFHDPSDLHHPLFQKPDLFIGESTTWGDPRVNSGKWNGHIHFEKLADYLCVWQPCKARIVHYAGEEDAAGEGRLAAYRALLTEGRRIHPRHGPTSLWELTAAMQAHLSERGYPSCLSIRAGSAGEAMVIRPRPT